MGERKDAEAIRRRSVGGVKSVRVGGCRIRHVGGWLVVATTAGVVDVVNESRL